MCPRQSWHRLRPCRSGCQGGEACAAKIPESYLAETSFAVRGPNEWGPPARCFFVGRLKPTSVDGIGRVQRPSHQAERVRTPTGHYPRSQRLGTVTGTAEAATHSGVASPHRGCSIAGVNSFLLRRRHVVAYPRYGGCVSSACWGFDDCRRNGCLVYCAGEPQRVRLASPRPLSASVPRESRHVSRDHLACHSARHLDDWMWQLGRDGG